jgi:hypothetical protein
MDIKPGSRDVTVYVGFRPFKDEWVERNEAVLAGLRWQNIEGKKIKVVCWPSESETAEYASTHGFESVVIPWYRQYLFPGPQRSFKNMFETILMDCDTEIFVYINGDVILGPGILSWLQNHVEYETLYSLPRHNWEYRGPLETERDFQKALSQSVPEEWTALDLFAFRATEGRKHLIPTPPFLLTAGSMDSWLVVKAGELGWRRVLIPPDNYYMLHIEHEYSHPLKRGASPEKAAKWAFNCGVYSTATESTQYQVKADTSLQCFEGAERYKFKYGVPQNEYQTGKEVFENSDCDSETE